MPPRAAIARSIPVLLCFLTPLLAAEKAQEPPAPIAYGPGRELCKLANPEIDESSGIAASRRHAGVFWTHNDAGNSARVFAFNARGEDLATVEVEGAISHDWEDIASFTLDGKPYLLIADIGDNDAMRDQYCLYIVPEPPLDPAKRGIRAKTRVGMAIEFRYEDEAHNCEAVAFEPATRTLLLVTKVPGLECEVFSLPLPKQQPKELLVARAIATLKLPMVTAMDVSPDGLRAVVLTYGNAYEFVRRPDEKWAQAFAQVPRMIRVPPRRQGESVCYGLDGKTLYLTSEKTPAPLIEIPVAQGK